MIDRPLRHVSAMSLARLGHQLRAAGLTQHGLLGWAGTHRLSALPMRVSGLAARPVVPAATALALFVGGAELAIDRLRALPLDALLEADLVATTGDMVHARVAILPLENTLVVCDRLDRVDEPDLVCCPDDSSYHLACALGPGRRPRWLDLGCGSAFAPLARPELATAITGIDLNPRAVRQARLGVALSGVQHLTAEVGDIAAPTEQAELVTCNAPIARDPDAAIWRATNQGFFDRLWSSLGARVAPGGEAVVHATLDAILPELPGELAIVVYTPPGLRAYAVAWWVPDRPSRRVTGYRELSPARPHVDPRDRDDVLAGVLPPLD